MLRLISLLALLVLAPLALAGDVAVSGDGTWRAVIGPPDRLVIHARDGTVARSFAAVSRDGAPAAFEGVYFDRKRRHFILPLQGVAEYWLIATDPQAPPVYEGFVHSREAGMIEALPSSQGLFARRRVLIEHALSGLEFSPDMREMTGLSADGRLLVTVNLNVNREVAWEPVAR